MRNQSEVFENMQLSEIKEMQWQIENELRKRRIEEALRVYAFFNTNKILYNKKLDTGILRLMQEIRTTNRGYFVDQHLDFVELFTD